MMNNIPFLFSILKFTFPDYFRLNVFPTQSKKTELQIENCPFQNYLFFLPPTFNMNPLLILTGSVCKNVKKIPSVITKGC